MTNVSKQFIENLITLLLSSLLLQKQFDLNGLFTKSMFLNNSVSSPYTRKIVFVPVIQNVLLLFLKEVENSTAAKRNAVFKQDHIL